MPLTPDPEFLAAMAPFAEAMAAVTPPPAGDVENRRANVEAMIAQVNSLYPEAEGVSRQDCTTSAADGTELALRWYTRDGSAPGSAVLYVHGGGMILGSVDLYDPTVAAYVAASGVPFLSVEYRLAPEHPHPLPLEDCYAGLAWLVEHAAELGVDPARIAVMGDSAGGGLAAAVALLARERGGPALARQILVYPMLDDRTTTPDPLIEPFAVWSYDDNVTGWGALLGDAAGGDDVPHLAAPARAADLSGLPPMYVEVGELDIFRDEDVEYARRASAAGVSAELHVHPGVPHAWELFARDAAVTRRALADRIRAITSF